MRTQKTPNFNTRDLRTQIPQRAAQTQTHRKKQPSSTKQKISTAWTSCCFAALSLTEATQRSCTSLGIKSIVNLRHFSRGGDKRAFGDQFWLANKPLRSWEIRPAQIADVLRTIRERQKEGAVLVHCYHGADRTGLVVAMYRVIYQGWSLDAARSEMIDGGYGFHSMWQDIAGFLTPQNEALVRAELGI